MAGKKGHQLNMHLSEEEYGWLVRYADKTDQSMASVARKALHLYIAMLKKKSQTKEQINGNKEAKGDLFLTSDEVVAGDGIQTSGNAG